MSKNLSEKFFDEDFNPDEVIAYLRKVAKTQIDIIMEIEVSNKPNKEHAAARARDARTLNELVHALERLDALEATRKAHGRKTKWKHDSERKATLVRRLDKLFETGRAAPFCCKR